MNSDNQKSKIKDLSRNIDVKTAGILWFTDAKLDYKSPGFYELNYLLNGALNKNFAIENNEHKSNFYLGDNFGSPFFVGHLIVETKNDFNDLDNQLKLAKPFLNERNHIYLFNKSKNSANYNILKELTAKYPSLIFEHLNI